MDGYMSKPVRLPELAEWIARSAPRELAVEPRESSAAPLSTEIIDPAQISSLGLDDDSLIEVLGIWLEDASRRFRQLGEAARSGDAARVRQISHALRGSSSNFGARALTAELSAVEANPDSLGDEAVRSALERTFARTIDGVRVRVLGALRGSLGEARGQTVH
jgi:HPt (histidine-containing phosphotransfer) domain-containing protein